MASVQASQAAAATSGQRSVAHSDAAQSPTASFLRQLEIQRSSPVPLYQQIKDNILAAIASGRLSVGAPLPSERELVDRLGVSRMTVRRALTELVVSGQLQTRPGKGTYVQPAKLEQLLSRLAGFSADLKRSGHAVTSRELRKQEAPADGEIAERLQVAPGEPIVILERVRLVDDVPTGWDRTHLLARLCPGIIRFDFTRASLYDVLRREYGLSLRWARQTIEAALANWREQQLLLVPEGAPILFGERTLYTDGDLVLEYGKSSYRADRYRYDISLMGDVADERP